MRSARDWKFGEAGERTRARNSRPLNEQLASSHPGPATTRTGGDTSKASPTLNPLFVETLMGWPTGWGGFGSAATAWSLWLPSMRGELSRLGSMMMDEMD